MPEPSAAAPAELAGAVAAPLALIAPPPRLYLGAFFASIVLELFSPLPLQSNGIALRIAGALVLLASAGFARWAFVTLRQAGTSADPRKSSDALTTRGPFGISRNPIYVAMTGLYVGATALLNTAWPLALLPPLLALMEWGVIRREERYLLARFGPSYADYLRRVRRWL